MSAYYLRVEAVNYANFLFDTDNISTRRGGSLTLLRAVATLRDHLDPTVAARLTPLAIGASIGLFAFDATDEADASAVRTAVAVCLRSSFANLPVQHATFVVDVVPVGESAGLAHERALAANRWRQMQEPSLSLADVFVSASGPCELDNVRPATQPGHLPDNANARVSAAVAERRRVGSTARQQFYDWELNATLELEFTDDLGSLAHPTVLPESVAPASTLRKIAVFYLDGNGFGGIGRARWNRPKPEEAYSQWSTVLREHHRGLLRDLLTRIAGQLGWQNGNALRLETLLWGGDEIIWVVPAWKGWELARWFFQQNHVVQLDGQEEQLTYKAGLVFCHAKAPIQNILNLAHNLADLARREPTVNAMAYEILESFDDITGDLVAHRRRGLPTNTPESALVLTGEQLAAMAGPLATLARSADFPRRQLYMLAHAWRTGEDTERPLGRLKASGAGAAFTQLQTALGSEVAWLHLLQLLPYLPTAAGALVP
jgi:hypothetical protein